MSTPDQRPKHKPSPKHTLDEVLKSLQDLIRNDLIDAETPSGDVPASASHDQRAPAQAKPAAAAPTRHAHTAATPPETVGKVLDSLRDLITHELADANAAASAVRRPTTPKSAAAAAPARKTQPAIPKTPDAPTRTKSQPKSPETAKADIDLPIEAQEPSAPAPAKAAAQETQTPRGGLQVEFPFNPDAVDAAGAPVSDETENENQADATIPAPEESADAANAANENYVDLDALGHPEQARARDSVPGGPDTPADTTVAESNEIPSIDGRLDDVTYELEVDGIRQELEDIVAAPPPEETDDIHAEPPLASAADDTPAVIDLDDAGEAADALSSYNVNWDDIPVLEEIAAHPDEELEPPDAAGMDTPAPPEAPPPAPGRAREIAVKVVAKLNIELRKCGERTLDPRTIDRLQYVLREALETEAAKVDNERDC